jgi:hypothetical protein
MTRFIAQIKNKGMVFAPQVRNMFIDHLKENDGDYLEIIPRKKKATVSDKLRGFYWGAWLPFIKNLDEHLKTYSCDDLHEFLKYEFNGTDVYNPITKQETRIVKSIMSNKILTQQAFIYMEKIRRWVAEQYALEMPNAQEYKTLRDIHFVVDKIEKVEYPTEEYDPKF